MRDATLHNFSLHNENGILVAKGIDYQLPVKSLVQQLLELFFGV